MKFYETVTETKEVVKLVKTTCDICGREKWDYFAWEGNASSIDNTTIEMEHGHRYPECGQKETTTFDICTRCFKSQIIPFLAQWKAEPQVKETDW